MLQWSNKPFGPATQWQTAMRFGKPIRALDTDDKTGQGVVVLNDSSTYVGSGVRVWGHKFYPAGTRIYSLYAIGESKMTNKLKIKVHESNISKEEILHLPISDYISKHPDKFKIVKEYDWSGLMCIQIFNSYKQEWFFLCDIRQGELLSSTGRPYIEVMGVFLDTWDDTITRIKNKDILSNGSVYSYMDSRALYGTKGLDKTWLDALTPNTLEALYERFTKFFKRVEDYYASMGINFDPCLYESYTIYYTNPTATDNHHKYLKYSKSGVTAVRDYILSLLMNGYTDISIHGRKKHKEISELSLEDLGIDAPAKNAESVKHTTKIKIKVHEKWNPAADKHTRNEYRTEMQRIVNPLSKGFFHDTDWNAVWKIRDALKDAFPKVKFELGAKDGGYDGNTKVYNLVAITPEGYELNGRIKCFAAGTKENPFDRYDMTVEIY